MPSLYVVLGAAAAILIAQTKITAASLTFAAVSTLFAAGNVVRVVVACRHTDLDNHDHIWERPCFLHRIRGEFYYRPSDFFSLAPPAGDSAIRIIDAVRVIHISPAAAWLDPDDLHAIHCLAWDVLRVLDESRLLRRAVDAGRPADLVAARDHVAAVDDVVSAVLECLDGAVLLIRAWEDKLANIEMRSRVVSMLDSASVDSVSIRRAAESLPQRMFAYITAARDVTHAGPFPWEHPGPSISLGDQYA